MFKRLYFTLLGNSFALEDNQYLQCQNLNVRYTIDSADNNLFAVSCFGIKDQNSPETVFLKPKTTIYDPQYAYTLRVQYQQKPAGQYDLNKSVTQDFRWAYTLEDSTSGRFERQIAEAFKNETHSNPYLIEIPMVDLQLFQIHDQTPIYNIQGDLLQGIDNPFEDLYRCAIQDEGDFLYNAGAHFLFDEDFSPKSDIFVRWRKSIGVVVYVPKAHRDLPHGIYIVRPEGAWRINDIHSIAITYGDTAASEASDPMERFMDIHYDQTKNSFKKIAEIDKLKSALATNLAHATQLLLKAEYASDEYKSIYIDHYAHICVGI